MKAVRQCCLLIGLVLAMPAMAEPLRIATILGPPWGFVGPDGKSAGIMYEIGNRIAEEAGLAYSNVLVPYARTAMDIEQGNADLLLRFSHEQLVRIAQPVATVVSMPVIAVGPKGTRFANVHALRGKTVGVIRTSKYVDAFDEDTAIGKYAVNDYVMMAKMVSAGRLDAGVGADAGFYYGAYAAGVKPSELGTPLVLGKNEFVLFLANSRATPERVKALKEAVRKLNASGEIGRIVDKYTAAFKDYWALQLHPPKP